MDEETKRKPHTNEHKMLDGDSFDACEMGMRILRERDLSFEVGDPKDPDSINEVFADFDLPYDIRLCGPSWYEVVRWEYVSE